MARATISKYSKIVAVGALLLLLIYGLYWLWQRQPKAKHEEETKTFIESVKPQETSPIAPKDFTVTKDAKITITGMLAPESFVAINSNAQQAIVTTQKDGKFEKQIGLAEGLNQIEVVNIAKDGSQISTQNLNYYFSKDKDSAPAFYAGTVKNIFNNLLTISTSAGDKKAKTNAKTKISLPKEETQSSTSSLVNNIRIGDFALILGNVDSEEVLAASTLEVLRDNKPQITEKLSIATVVSAPKFSVFNAKEKDQIREFTANADTQIQLNGDKGKIEDIKKDKKALVFWHGSKDKKVTDLVFILP